jgi:hypothetical protein
VILVETHLEREKPPAPFWLVQLGVNNSKAVVQN